MFMARPTLPARCNLTKPATYILFRSIAISSSSAASTSDHIPLGRVVDFRSALIRRERVSKRPTRWGALRGLNRTFNPFHRGVVTTYALEVGAAGDRDNRDHDFSAFRAARYPIHEILPLFFHHKQRFNCCLRHTQLPAACAHVQADRNAGDHALCGTYGFIRMMSDRCSSSPAGSHCFQTAEAAAVSSASAGVAALGERSDT